MKKILAIDDNRTNLLLIKDNLVRKMPECEVTTCLSGSEGIKIAKNEQPDVILLDILMPGMDGYQVCEILKCDPNTKNIPILLVSALGNNTDDRIKGLNLGADAFISKPFEPLELITQIRVLLRIKSAEDLLRKQNQQLEVFIKKQTIDFNNSESRYLQISEYAREFFWEVDTQGRYTYVSEVVENILGIENHQIIGKKDLFNFPETTYKELVKQSLIDVFEERNNYNGVELFCFGEAGKKTWLTLNGFPIFDNSSNFMGYRGVTQDITERRQAEEDLEKSHQEIVSYQTKLKLLNRELIIAEEKERRRIAEYLHDGIGPVLSLAHIKLSSLSNKNLPPEIQKTIGECAGNINTAIIQSRLLTYDLSPPILYELGLIPAIRWKLDSIKKDSHLDYSIKGEETDMKLNNDTRVLVYRVICELLLNVIKHAQATHIKFKISKDDKQYHFYVIDNGCGFNFDLKSNSELSGGHGLFSINERLDSMQGSLHFKSSEKSGTSAKVSIPIN